MDLNYLTIQDIYIENDLYSIEVRSQCPYCSNFMLPILLSHSEIRRNKIMELLVLSATFECPACNTHFLETYTNYNDDEYQRDSRDNLPIITFTDSEQRMSEISERFLDIYKQSLQADKLGLYEIAGLGLRKALEFLISDFLIMIGKDVEDTLGKSINILETNIRIPATAISWIGNDEAHLNRKHTDKDIEDMKKYMVVLIRLLSSELDFLEAKGFTSTPKKNITPQS